MYSTTCLPSRQVVVVVNVGAYLRRVLQMPPSVKKAGSGAGYVPWVMLLELRHTERNLVSWFQVQSSLNDLKYSIGHPVHSTNTRVLLNLAWYLGQVSLYMFYGEAWHWGFTVRASDSHDRRLMANIPDANPLSLTEVHRSASVSDAGILLLTGYGSSVVPSCFCSVTAAKVKILYFNIQRYPCS